jgi:cyclic pyranopterin phosphate synthase
MPSEGITYLPKKELLSYEEMLRITEVFSSLGISKVRLTGGEPFLRKNFVSFLKEINQIKGIEAVHITTNGVLTHKYLDDIQNIGVAGINLSLDSLNREKFHKITRRDEFDTVMKTMDGLLDRNIQTKINMVVMHGKNTDEIVDMARLSKDKALSVRFIEEMPFNGSELSSNQSTWNYLKIIDTLKSEFGDMEKLNGDPSNPATLYALEGHKGNVGVIPAFSRTFCGACNRIRLTALGSIKNCLYDEGVLDLKQLLRSGKTDAELREILIATVQKRVKNGFEAEKNRTLNPVISDSMASIGG